MTSSSHANHFFQHRIVVGTGIVALYAILIVLIWHIAEVFLVLFGAILFAILLDGLTRLLQEVVPMPRGLGLGVVIVSFCLALTGIFILGSPQISQQIAELNERLPQDIAHIRSVLSERMWGQVMLKSVPEPQEVAGSITNVLGRLGGAFSTAVGAVTNSIIILIIGFYLAIHPAVYTQSAITLFPSRQRERITQVMNALGRVLRWWLVGRIAAMTAVGILTTVGLWLVGMPLALALGFIAGLLSFVPFIGPVASAVPAILIALVEGPWQAAYVVLVYTIVQFLEGNLITPLIQRRTVSLPPAALLIGQVFMGVLFGLLGILLATPAIIVVILIVQMLYIQDVLKDSVPLLGEHGKS